MLPGASRRAFGREKTLLTSSIQFLPDTRMIPRAAGASAVAIEVIGSSGVY